MVVKTRLNSRIFENRKYIAEKTRKIGQVCKGLIVKMMWFFTLFKTKK